MMKSSVSVKLGTVLLIVCLCDAVMSDRQTLRRQRRGFRNDAATRVAHGFGKRDYMSPSSNQFSQFSIGALDNSQNNLDGFSDGSIMTVDEFAQLLTLHPSLGKALLKKFVDVDGDDIISTAELFRPVIIK